MCISLIPPLSLSHHCFPEVAQTNDGARQPPLFVLETLGDEMREESEWSSPGRGKKTPFPFRHWCRGYRDDRRCSASRIGVKGEGICCNSQWTPPSPAITLSVTLPR